MKTKSISRETYAAGLTVSLALASTGLGSTLVNNSFEDGLTGWTASGNVTTLSGSPYVSTQGSAVAVFNSSNSTPGGVLKQTFQTARGQGYLLDFDVGNLAYVNHEQKLRVKVTQAGGSVVLLDQQIAIPATTLGGATTWQACHFSFTTGAMFQAGDNAEIRFTDESAFTNSQDLVLDHVRLIPAPVGTFTRTGSLNGGDAVVGIGRANHAATRLNDGRVLVTGGYRKIATLPKMGTLTLTNSAEVFDGTKWTATGGMIHSRNSHTATTLLSGKVLVVGGNADTTGISHLAEAELYDPSSGAWTAAGSLPQGRIHHTATRLSDGNILIAGGENAGSGYGFDTCHLYNPTTNSWSATGTLSHPRHSHTAVLLMNGKVLVTGGAEPAHASSAEIYDPSTGSWTTTGSMEFPRFHHTTTRMEDGRVLAVGGLSGNDWNPVPICELYDPATGQWARTGTPATWRHHHSAVLLADGKILLTGGVTAYNFQLVGAAEVYDPATSQFNPGGTLEIPRCYQQVTALPDGRILVTGGITSAFSGSGPESYSVATAEIHMSSQPDKLTVTTLADENDGWNSGGTGNSLREAVAKVQLPPFPNQVDFAPGLDGGTIVLGGSPLNSSAPVDIDATALTNGITVSGNHASKIFQALFAPATLRNLTLTASSGAAIRVAETRLDLIDCRLHGNTTTGDGGALEIFNPFHSSAHITRCTFSDNTATGRGGAIYNEGHLFVRDCTFTGNTAGETGGAIWTGPYRSALTATNSTFAGNSAVGDGGAIEGSAVKIIHSTICGNSSSGGSGGGVHSFSSAIHPDLGFTITNSIIAGNTASSQPDVGGTIDAYYGQNFTSGDPMLAPLENYGGRTRTRPPLPGSPVIDTATVLSMEPPFDHSAYTGLETDQAGRTRPGGPLPDIGAAEAFPFSGIALVDTDQDGIDDRLETAYGFTIGQEDGTGDADGDGSSNADEIANMTDPFDSNSSLKIVRFAAATDLSASPEWEVEFTSFPGLSYSVEFSDTLDFTSPETIVQPCGVATCHRTTLSVELAPQRDFLRIRRDK